MTSKRIYAIVYFMEKNEHGGDGGSYLEQMTPTLVSEEEFNNQVQIIRNQMKETWDWSTEELDDIESKLWDLYKLFK